MKFFENYFFLSLSAGSRQLYIWVNIGDIRTAGFRNKLILMKLYEKDACIF